MILFHKQGVRFELKEKMKYKKWLKNIADNHGFTIRDLNYIFMSDTELLKINQEYLDHNTFTDIITFDASEEENNISGDIFISIERVRENAKTYNMAFQHELLRVMAHGLLHLIGFGDKTNDEKAEMRKQEDLCIINF